MPSITAAGNQADGAESVEREEGQRSSTASSNESEPFELIEAPSAGVWLQIHIHSYHSTAFIIHTI